MPIFSVPKKKKERVRDARRWHGGDEEKERKRKRKKNGRRLDARGGKMTKRKELEEEWKETGGS